MSDPNWWVAIGTGVLAIFTGLLFFYTYKLWNTTRSALQLARNEFITVHRPRLIVRNIVLKKPDRYHTYFKSDSPPSGQFYVENAGGSDALVVDSYCNGHCTEGELPMQRPYEGKDGNGPVAKITLKPGLSSPGLFEVTPWFPSHVQEVNQGKADWKFFIYGWIEYHDTVGTRYRTAFCRRWDAQTERFVAVHDPDYEHG
jgi:hypothetical protein